MTKSKPYSLINVNHVNLAKVMEEFLDAPELWVGVDVDKEFLKVVLCWGEKCFSRPWNVSYPDDLGVLMDKPRGSGVILALTNRSRPGLVFSFAAPQPMAALSASARAVKGCGYAQIP